MIPPAPRLPLEPLIAMYGLNEAVTQSESAWHNHCAYEVAAPFTILAELLGVTRRTVGRWAVCGIPLSAAEDAAFVLSLHPCEVWGDQWIGACVAST